jgi:hypothetical protein
MKTLMMLIPLALLPTACMTYDDGRVGELGDTVYATHYEQIADKQRAANPGSEPAAVGTDGPLTEKVLEGYRGKTSDARQVGQPIQINVE